jgi:integrase
MAESQSIRVLLKRRADRNVWYMYYVCPTTDKQVTKSTKQEKQRDAARVAAAWEDELLAGVSQNATAMTWCDFRDEYERLHLSSLAPESPPPYIASMNHLQRIINPHKLSAVTTVTLDNLAATLRTEGMRETTIRANIRHLGAILKWAFQRNYIRRMPNLPDIKRAKGVKMRGRPINGEEFERMLLAAEKVRPNDSDKWKQLLTGLYLSGLRISDAMKVSWEWSSPFALVMSGKHPVFHIAANAQKAPRDEVVPLTPDFAAFVMETPENARKGWVFNILDDDERNMSPHHASRVIAKIGRRAAIQVNPHEKKFASAHDLRRSFGTRWAKRNIAPAALRKLMRHARLETTLEYYVLIDADDLASELWKNYGPDAKVSEPFPEPSPILATSRAHADEAV